MPEQPDNNLSPTVNDSGSTGLTDSGVGPVTERPGDRIGRYKLLQRINEGGMGVVYMAEQEEPVRRRVALKIIKLGMDTKQVIARFEAERQALALMDHPNIAKVLDAGATDKGRPFFVMELVKGIHINEYCDQNNLSTRQRLELFIQVCHAIQHAHQKGIIHRDIKPHNILVTLHDGMPVPKVVDFGIAKATSGQRLTDKTLFTAFEQFVGTPVYMSPEQAEMSGLDIDTRTDIYALGVLLYELLTGKTPFDAKRLQQAALDEVRRIIREEEPQRPSTRLSTLDAAELTTIAKHRQSEPPKLLGVIRGDLDWIAMRCLEKDRTRRYDTANGLAMDIQRYLTSEPIVARPPSNLYRFQKLVRRNKLVFAGVAAIMAALAVGASVSTWQAVRARRAEQAAKQERERAMEEAKRAETQKALAEQATEKEQRLLDFTSADYMLSQGRLDEAYANIAKAIQGGSSWEYGHLLGKIVCKSRDDWRLVMRVAIADRPSNACFVGGETPYLVLADDGGAKLLSVADGRLLSARGPTDVAQFAAVPGSRCAVVTRGGKVLVYRLPEWQQVGSYESGEPIVCLKADPTGHWLGVLDRQATVSVLDLGNMHEAALRSFKSFSDIPALAQGRIGLFPQEGISFSPSGKQLVFNSGHLGQPTVVWDWLTNGVTLLSIRAYSAQIYADNRVVGYDSVTSPSDTIRLSFHDLDRDSTQAQSPIEITLREVLTSGKEVFEARGSPSRQRGIPDLRAAVISPDAINQIALRGDNNATSVARFGSLWPHAHDELMPIAFDPDRQLLGLSGSSDVLVFQFRERFPALPPSTPGARLDQEMSYPLPSRDYRTHFWSMGATHRELLVDGDQVGDAAGKEASHVYKISRINYETQADSPIYCEGPEPLYGREMTLWGIACASNSSTLSLLWQESSFGTNPDSPYYRKAVAIYDLQQEQSIKSPLKPKRIIWLGDYEGLGGRGNRLLGISPQGRTAIFCYGGGRTTGYRLQDGQKIYDFIAGHSFALSPDGALFAAGDYAEHHPVRVWEVETGKLITSTSTTGLVRRIAFSPNSQLLYVGWTSDILQVFSAKDGSLVGEVKSGVSPVAVSPLGDRYVGFIQDKNQPTSGSMVLASLSDGQAVLVLNRLGHILNSARFSPDGRSIAFARNQDSIALLKSFTPQEAEHMLARIEPMVAQVTFTYVNVDAKTVHVAGEFNRWLDNVDGKVTGKQEWLMQNDGAGGWRLTTQLPLGFYKFKYVINGGEKWEQDPKLPASPDNARDSIIEVKAQSQPATLLSRLEPMTVQVTFAYMTADAKTVHVAGEFNQWLDNVDGKVTGKQEWLMQSDRSGGWKLTTQLLPGRYKFKYVINGGERWEQDPRFPASADGNSMIEVKAQEQPAVPSTASIGGTALSAAVQTTFTYGDASARAVFLTGQFNKWSTMPLHKDDKGLWTVTVLLQPGRYQYKFIVDGNWRLDPNNPDSADDGNGNRNSVRTITQEKKSP